MPTHHHTQEQAPLGSLALYCVGFALSIVITLFAFWIAPTLPTAYVYAAFILAALAQLVVQLVFFLHLGSAGRRGWNLIILAYTLALTFILVGGTLWIMYNLAHHALPVDTTGTFLNGDITPQNSLD